MPKEKRNEKLTSYSQRLRKEMTKEERHLWYDFLKGLPLTVHRQQIIGSYIADFYFCSPAKKIVVELDGSQHYEPKKAASDSERNRFMEARGITVLRYSNLDVNQHFASVCEDILLKAGLLQE